MVAAAMTNSTRSDDEIRSEVRDWLHANLPPAWVEAVQAGDEAGLARARAGVDYNQWCARLGEAGWATPTWPTEYGGAGLEAAQAKIVNEELNRYRVLRSFNVIGIGMGGPTIMRWGSDELKLRYLPPMAQHKEIWCQLFSEPGAGSDVAGLATRATRDGDEWIVNGQKVWTTLAHMASYGLLVARTDPDAPKHKGLSYFVVDMHAPGVEVRPLKQITGDAEFNEVFFTDVRIPDSHRLGPVGEGWAVATTTLMNERVALSGAGSIGGGNVGGGPVDALVASARASGASRDANLRQRLVQAYIEGRLVQITNFRAGAARKSGREAGPEGSVTKLFQAEYNQRLQNLAVDLLGADGMAWDGPPGVGPLASVVHGFLRSRANTIEGGTSEIMRNILGERVLGLPKEPAVDRDVPWSQVARS
ncbi:MAG: acyl-CoA dehydrogenase family protein [Acidimicrobiales bacterium]